jgi:CheY-like chemotaxis protein
MKGDRTRVRQILLNLLSNANKFTDRGSITVIANRETVDDRDWIEIKVVDTGKGISPEDQKRLFQPFFQADASSTRKHDGTGLGLAISRRFSNLMGGDITVQSEIGKGSTFTLRLPAQTVVDESRRAALKLPEAARDREIRQPARKGQPVLIIDDDPTVRELMSRYLTKEGFMVLTAASGQQGITLAHQAHPAAITLDAMMPGMDGWAVLTALKSDPATAQIPIIMVTIVDDKTRGFTLGATDYLTKPIDWNRLSTVLKTYADSSPLPVLVVEDDKVAREVMVRMLQRLGWQVVEAENGRIALEKYRKQQPALILLDLMMPEMDGFQFVEELQKLPNGHQTPIIVITARDLSDDDRRRLNGYVQQVLRKSAQSPEQLADEIQQKISRTIGDEAGLANRAP